MKVTTTMTREQFNQWMEELQNRRKPTKAEWNSVPVSAKAKARLVNEAASITMQEVMVSWTYDQWKENK